MNDVLRSRLADLADEMVPVDLRDRVLAGSAKAKVRHTASLAVVLVGLAGAVVGVTLVARTDRTAPLSPAVRVTTLPTGMPEDLQPYPVSKASDPGPLAASTLDLPTWPGADYCPTGPVHFTKGVAVLPTSDVDVTITRTATTDVNRDSRDDAVAILECRKGASIAYQVLAYSSAPSGGAAQPARLGQVIASGQAGVVGIFDLAAEAAGSVRVRVGDRAGGQANSAALQWRSYSFVGGRFSQTSGPTGFAADPPAVRLAASAVPVITTEEGGVRVLTVAVTVSNSGSVASSRLVLQVMIPQALAPAGSGWSGCIADQSGPVEGQIRLQCPLAPIEPGAARSVSMKFVVPGSPSLASPEAAQPGRANGLVVVGQVPPTVLERDFADNAVQFPVS